MGNVSRILIVLGIGLIVLQLVRKYSLLLHHYPDLEKNVKRMMERYKFVCLEKVHVVVLAGPIN